MFQYESLSLHTRHGLLNAHFTMLAPNTIYICVHYLFISCVVSGGLKNKHKEDTYYPQYIYLRWRLWWWRDPTKDGHAPQLVVSGNLTNHFPIMIGHKIFYQIEPNLEVT